MDHRQVPSSDFPTEKMGQTLCQRDDGRGNGDCSPHNTSYSEEIGELGPQRHSPSGSITRWRGFLPCLVIFALTGLLILSNMVNLKDGCLYLQRQGSLDPGSATVIDGDIEPSSLTPSPGFNHEVAEPGMRFRFPVMDSKAGTKLQSRAPDVTPEATTATSTAAASPTRTVLQNYQLAEPVLMPYGTSDSDGSTDDDGSLSQGACKVQLMRRDFAFSYNDPFVANYTPPDCEFNRVVINFTAVSVGRQYDRLAIMYLGDIEVWRTSTAEPTIPPGIRWVYLKDMTQFLSLWKQPQTLIFDLGNLVSTSLSNPRDPP